jgi:hypothetical protein
VCEIHYWTKSREYRRFRWMRLKIWIWLIWQFQWPIINVD